VCGGESGGRSLQALVGLLNGLLFMVPFTKNQLDSFLFTSFLSFLQGLEALTAKASKFHLTEQIVNPCEHHVNPYCMISV